MAEKEKAEVLNIYDKLVWVQNELKAPKSQFNKFGGYKYRNNEDILEAVKPLLLKYKLTLIVGDEVVLVGERYYIKATATLVDTESALTITNTALAREEESKKGMDASQLTGSTSSYARKYCLNGLFAIDDTKDSDTTNNGVVPEVDEEGVSLRVKAQLKNRVVDAEVPYVAQPLPNIPQKISQAQVSELNELLNQLPMERQVKFLEWLKAKKKIDGGLPGIETKQFAEVKTALASAI